MGTEPMDYQYQYQYQSVMIIADIVAQPLLWYDYEAYIATVHC